MFAVHYLFCSKLARSTRRSHATPRHATSSHEWLALQEALALTPNVIASVEQFESCRSYCTFSHDGYRSRSARDLGLFNFKIRCLKRARGAPPDHYPLNIDTDFEGHSSHTTALMSVRFHYILADSPHNNNSNRNYNCKWQLTQNQTRL